MRNLKVGDLVTLNESAIDRYNKEFYQMKEAGYKFPPHLKGYNSRGMHERILIRQLGRVGVIEYVFKAGRYGVIHYIVAYKDRTVLHLKYPEDVRVLLKREIKAMAIKELEMPKETGGHFYRHEPLYGKVRGDIYNL